MNFLETRLFVNVPGDIHNRIHVLRVSETVPEAHEAQREATATAGLEEMVHADTLCLKVRHRSPLPKLKSF